MPTGQQPYIYQHQVQFQQVTITELQGQSPFTYNHRSPFTYQDTGRNPIANVSAQQPFPYIANGQQPYPYIANARDPSTYQHQSPLTYRNPVSGQQPHIVNKQSPFFYTGFYEVAYAYRSPFIAQVQQPSTRPVGPVAKVKGIYRNNNGTVEKVNQVYVNDGGSLEKIHQSVPTAQFQK